MSTQAQDQDRDKIASYIDKHPQAVIGTINQDGTPHGAVVHICTGHKKDTVYFLTKNGTQKYKNLVKSPILSITIYDEAYMSTMQAQGKACLVYDAATLELVVQRIAKAEARLPELLPPIAKLQAGAYAVFEVILTNARLAEYRGHTVSSKRIFTEI